MKGDLIRPHHSKLSATYRVVDGLLIIAGLWLVCKIYALHWNDRWSLLVACALLAFYFFAQVSSLYRSWRIVPIRGELLQLGIVWLSTSIALFLFLLFINRGLDHLFLDILLSWFAITLSTLAAWRVFIRIIFHTLRRHGRNTRTVAIVGANPFGIHLADTINAATWMGLRLVGFYDDRHLDKDRTATLVAGQILGNLDDLLAVSREGGIDLLYIALPLRAEKRIRELVDKLADTTISVYIVPDFFTFDLLHGRWYTVGDIPVISIYETPFYGISGWIKRLEDISLGGIFLALSLVPMCLIAIGIKLSSRGPIFFKQRRYGINGQQIMVWKFRSMHVCEDGAELAQATREDGRITPFGAFLRRSSLDELPQLFNVLLGTMSLVGPRPHAVAHNEYYRLIIHRYMLRHKVKPGITGWAQVNGWRGETETTDKMKKRIEYDLEYIRHWSLFFDLKILYLTLIRCLRDKNAY